MEWNAQDCGISKAAKDTSMLPSKIDQMKVSHEGERDFTKYNMFLEQHSNQPIRIEV